MDLVNTEAGPDPLVRKATTLVVSTSIEGHASTQVYVICPGITASVIEHKMHIMNLMNCWCHKGELMLDR